MFWSDKDIKNNPRMMELKKTGDAFVKALDFLGAIRWCANVERDRVDIKFRMLHPLTWVLFSAAVVYTVVKDDIAYAFANATCMYREYLVIW